MRWNSLNHLDNSLKKKKQAFNIYFFFSRRRLTQHCPHLAFLMWTSRGVWRRCSYSCTVVTHMREVEQVKEKGKKQSGGCTEWQMDGFRSNSPCSLARPPQISSLELLYSLWRQRRQIHWQSVWVGGGWTEGYTADNANFYRLTESGGVAMKTCWKVQLCGLLLYCILFAIRLPFVASFPRHTFVSAVLLSPTRRKCFHPCLFVGWMVCQQDYKKEKNPEQISTKLGWWIGLVQD